MRIQPATSIRWRFLLVNLLVIAIVYSPVIASEPEATSRKAEKEADVGASKEASAELAPKAATHDEPAPAPLKPDDKPGSSEPVSTGAESSSEADIKRRGRAESVSQAAPAAPASEGTKTSTDKPPAEKSKPEPAPVKSSAGSKGKPSPPPRASSTKSKLHPNLGAVTSTGSGGATHYMSKGDPFQAIEQKHAMMSAHSVDLDKRSDKRTSSAIGGLKHFGIQKAGGISDYLNPFKVTDNGLARTLGASMRSIIKGKYSVPAYVASALLGAVALMAFYESPMSPLPVPPLPEPPVGRFPPEMPILPANTQVPFRQNQGHYNQRSSMVGLQQPMYPQQQQQQQQQYQQVVFPGSQVAQQRQMSVAPIQQLAANLVPFSKPIQRKSSIEYDNILTRSSQPAGKPQAGHSKSNSILSFFGFGGSPASQQTPASSPSDPQAAQQASAPVNEPKGPQSSSGPGMSNSHLVNKVKSYFNRAAGSQASSSPAGDSHATGNLYDQYQKMSFVQALMKDTAFIPAFLTSNRKSSPASSSQANKFSGAGSNVAAARMQVEAPVNAPPASILPPKQRSGGYGLSRISDKIAHALLETFASGIVQRSGLIGSDKISARKSAGPAADEHYASTSDLASATGSILSDIILNLNQLPEQQQQQQHHLQQQQQLLEQQQQQQHVAAAAADHQQQQLVAPKAADSVAAKPAQLQTVDQVAPKAASQTAGASVEPQQSVAVPHPDQAQPEQLVRKTRSIGFEYPVENGASAGARNNNSNNNQELGSRESLPNKATQINNVIDFVADSYTNNRLLFNFFMNQIGLSHAVPYVEQIFASGNKQS